MLCNTEVQYKYTVNTTMITKLLLILAYPFWFATGMAGRKLVPTDPKFSLIYAHVVYWTCAYWHWHGSQALWQILVGVSVNWLLVQCLCRPKYQAIVLLAWAATDVIAATTGRHSALWDWILLLVYVALSLSEPDDKINHQ